jgi:hypothetical protein
MQVQKANEEQRPSNERHSECTNELQPRRRKSIGTTSRELALEIVVVVDRSILADYPERHHARSSGGTCVLYFYYQ